MQKADFSKVFSVEQIAAFKALSNNCKDRSDVLKIAYFDLIRYMREQQFESKYARVFLLQEGWHKAKVSEFLKVANCSQALFDQYQAKLIGFKASLERARQEKLCDTGKAVLLWQKFEAAGQRLASGNVNFRKGFAA